jgi:hypothetical protein
MQTLTTILSGLLPLAGVVIGASLQYYFSRSSEQRKQLALLRTQAYVDFLSSVAKLAQAAKANQAERFRLLAEAADSKTRICIYGSKESIALLAEFERKGAQLDSKDSIGVFIRLCSQMRKEGLSAEPTLPKEDLEIVLFGPGRPMK